MTSPDGGPRPLRWLSCLGWCLLAVGCSVFTSQTALPRRHAVVLDQLVVHSDFSVPQRHRLLDDLRALRGTVQTTLGLPASDEPIHVYLFERESDYYAFLDEHYPEFPARRACFVQTDTALSVYAHWGDRIAEDLRHEVSHGYIHAAAPTVPLWLDEGLAEYFETPRGHQGLNRAHVELLNTEIAAANWQPNLERVASLQGAGDMTQVDYAEAWAWIHFLVEGRPEWRSLVQGYLAALREARPVEPLPAQVRRQIPGADSLLVEHVRTLAGSMGG